MLAAIQVFRYKIKKKAQKFKFFFAKFFFIDIK